jgi:hypothetical protein
MYANADLQHAIQALHETTTRTDAASRPRMAIGNPFIRLLNWLNSGWSDPNRNPVGRSAGTDFIVIHGHVVHIAASREATGADAYSM